jgi:NAD(P)-dependent dehydrogenase (short-subunit alcohol dehydrogenase family)
MNDSILNIFNLKGKVVVLTGSAGRIGSRFAEVLSSAGAKLVLVDIDDKSNTKLASKLQKQYGKNITSFTTDFTDEGEIQKLVTKVIKSNKKIDVLINNAHYLPRDHPLRDAPFEKYPLELWNEAITKNLQGVFLCCREFGKYMVKQKSGNIINISSIYGITGPDQRIYGKSRLNSPAFYSTTKGGIVSLTKYLASYWNGKNIRVNTLTLGGVFDKKLHTDKNFVKNYSKKTMIGRMGNTNDYDGAILFLTSDTSSYMTGANLIIDGGWTSW